MAAPRDSSTHTDMITAPGGQHPARHEQRPARHVPAPHRRGCDRN